MKRFCCMLLCLCMLIPILSIQGFADDTVQEGDAAQGVSIISDADTYVKFTKEGTGAKMYLSDFSTSSMLRCKVGWGSYMRDRNIDNKGPVTLHKTTTTTDTFEKSVAAHASADLIYDLGANHTYNIFHSWVGVDASKGGNGDGVTFKFYLSDDGTNWDPIEWSGSGTVYKGNSVATEVNFDIKGHRYFRVVCDKGANDSYDHSSLGDAYFIDSSNDYSAPEVSLPECGSLTIGSDANQAGFRAIVNDENSELALLQYTLFQKCGEDNLRTFFTASSQYKERVEAFNWLYNDYEALQEFMNGGIPNDGSYISALEVFASIYAAHSEDLKDETKLYEPDSEHKSDTRGDLYRRMMLSLSLVCAGGWSGWMSNAGIQNPVKRYEYFKENYTSTATNADGTTSVSKMRCDIFENLGVDEMRWVVGNNIANAEIVWLNDYARKTPRGGNQTSYPILYSPHHHISYQWYNYDKDEFYADENKDTYCNKYYLTGYENYGLTYGLTDGMKVQRLWMVFEDGAVCGNISRTGANLGACFGVPACEVGQPGHAAFLIMGANSSTGEMTWGIDNDISGWMYSTNSRRMPCDWGLNGDSWISGCRASYVLLSQAALNHLGAYSKAEEIMMMYDRCTTDAQREACCRAALSYMQYHLDAWLKLVQMYCADDTKTASELTKLAEELCADVTGTDDIDTCMCYYPKPMYDLMQLIINRIKTMSTNAGNELSAAETNLESNPDDESLKQAKTEAEDKKIDIEVELANCQMILNTALKRAASTTDAAHKCAQPSACRQNANYYLSNSSYNLATFSFDGDNANKIVFNSDFTSVRFKISLDGGTSWGDSISRYAENGKVIYDISSRLDEIKADTDIYIWLDGWSGDPNTDNAFCIDISGGITEAGIKNLVEANDYEDRMLGTLTSLQYSTDDGETWKDLTADTEFSGDLTVKIHKKASGTTLQSADATFKFTDNNKDNSRYYVKLNRLSVFDFSTEAANHSQQAVKAIDGLESTIWHTDWGGGDSKRYITLKADKPTFFSGIDYLPRTDAGNGTITYCEVQVSVDGTSWYTAATASWNRDSSVKSITFTDAAYGQYIRIIGKSASGNFCSAREIRVFENKNFEGKTVAGARLTQEPTKLTYAEGEEISFDGAVVECVYTDGSTHKVPLSMLTVSPKYAEGEGTQEVSLKYLNLPAMTFEIYVTPNTHTASKLTIDSPASKTSYTLGSKPDTAGLVLLATEESSGTVWKVNDGEYTVSPSEFTQKGTQKVTLTYQGITAEYEVTVIGKPESIAITTSPSKTTYEIGEALDVDDMVVTVTYADETTEDLEYSTGRLLISGDGFSSLPGEKVLTVALADDRNLTVDLPVTVLANLVVGEFCYDVEPSTENPPQYTCYLSGYTNASDTVVSVPASVTCNGITYQVVGVRSGAFETASQVEYLSLPGTIQTLEENSLSSLTGLKQLYLTGISDIDNLTIENGALPEQSAEAAGTIYMAGDDMETALGEKLEDYRTTGDGEFNMQKGNLADDAGVDSITVTAPDKTIYELDETYEPAGFTVTAQLSNGIELPLESTLYTMGNVSTSVYGQHTFKVTYSGDESKTGSFSIEVLKTAPTVLASPVDGVYLPGDENISAISVAVNDGDKIKLKYQWYKSESGSLKPGNDTAISNATGSSYKPTDTGYYYAAIWRLDAKGNMSNPVYSMAAHIQVQDFAIRALDAAGKGTYYDALDEAMAKASSGSTIYLRKSIDVERQSTIVSKTLTIAPEQGLADSVTIKRASGYAGCLIEANNCNLTIENVILDGGAVWEGDTDASLGRGTTNSGVAETASLLRMQNNTQLTLNGATVQNCAVQSSGGAWGAAVYVTSGADLTITGSTVKNNALGNGGCGVIQTDSADSVITVSNSTFTGNYAPKNGGAFCISNGKLDFKSGTISYCKAGTNGGGIFVDTYATAVFTGTIENCSAPSGGGIYTNNGITLTDGTLKNCSATGNGGGLFVNGGTAIVTGGSLEGCTAATNGGGIYTENRDVTVNNTIFSNCTTPATNGTKGGAIYTGNNQCNVTGATFTKCYGYDGGAIYTNSGNINIVDCNFKECSAGACGGCVCTASGTVDVSGSSIFDSCTAKLAGALWTNTGVIKVRDNAKIDSCKAIINSSGGMGGAISTLSGRIEILGGTISNCTATDGGGAVRTDSGAIIVSGGTIDSCSASANGGALLTASGAITISGGTIKNCTASGNGGAIYTNSGAMNMTGGVIDGGNTSENSVTNAVFGGGIYSNSGAVTLTGGTIENCGASDNGGGIYVNTAALNFENGTISGCIAANNGGAACTDTGAVTMTGGVIDACKAVAGGGGAICTVSGNNSSGSVTVNGGTIRNCTAGYIGGCLYSSNAGIITVDGGSFENNTAKYGGAIGTNSYNTQNTYINGGTYSGNKATEKGGVIFIGGGSTAHVKGGIYKNNTAANGGSIYCAWNGGKHNFTGGLFIYDGEWGSCLAKNSNNPTVKITGGTYSTELKQSDGLDNNYKVVDTELQISSSENVKTVYTVVGISTQCGEGNHSYAADKVAVTEPTCKTQGFGYEYCSVCGARHYVTLDVLEHDYQIVDGVKTCTRCGEKKSDTLPTQHVQQTESGSVIPTAEESASGISETYAKDLIENTVDNNTSVSNYESPDMSGKVKMEAAKSALQDASKTVAEDFDVTQAETSVYAQVTLKEAKIETRTFSSEGKTAITQMTFDVKPVISTLVTKTSGTDSWSTLLTAVIPNDAITGKISFRLPIDSSIPAGSSVIVWHHDDTTGEKNYFGTYAVLADGDNKYVQLESKEFSTYSYELPGDGYDLEGLARSLTIDESLSINYKVKVNGYTDAYMVFEFYDDTVTENDGYVETRVDTFKTGSYNGSDCLVFSFEGVNPQRMMDNLKATLYAKYGDEIVSYTFDDYSVATYLTRMDSNLKDAAYDSTRAVYYELFGNLIAYGAEAQTSQNYEKNNLISTAFENNENYKSKDYDANGVTAIKKLTKKDGGVSIKSATLVLSGYVGVRVFFTLEEGVSLDDAKFTAAIEGRTTEAPLTYDADDFTPSGDRYYFTIRGITATEFGSQITVQAYVKNTQVENLATSAAPDTETEAAEESDGTGETVQTGQENETTGETEETAETKETNETVENGNGVNSEADGVTNEIQEQSGENAESSGGDETEPQSGQSNDTQDEYITDDVVHYNVYSYLTKYMGTDKLVKALFNYGRSASALADLSK